MSQDWILVLGLALRGVTSDSHLISGDGTAWRLAVLSLMRALAHCVLPMAETLSKAWLYRGILFSHIVGLDRVGAGGGH